MLGDCYAAAVVEHLSKAELQSSPSHGSIVKNLAEKDVSAFLSFLLMGSCEPQPQNLTTNALGFLLWNK
jgi:hypothetical protein